MLPHDFGCGVVVEVLVLGSGVLPLQLVFVVAVSALLLVLVSGCCLLLWLRR